MDDAVSYPWVPGLAIGLAVAASALVAVAWWWRARGGESATRLAAANRLAQLGEYWRVVATRRSLLALLALATLVAIAAAAQLAARPVRVDSQQSTLDSRDIVLCLDSSSSMTEEVAAIVDAFVAVAAGLEGERISLVLFNSQPVVALPLTDDYSVIAATLADLDGQLDSGTSVHQTTLAEPTFRPELGQSRVGDGLVGCVHQFRADEDVAALRGEGDTLGSRSRVVVFATDNAVFGVPDGLSIADGSDYANQLGARVLVIDANRSGGEALATPERRAELRALARDTGGGIYSAAAESTVDEIVAIVDDLDAQPARAQPVIRRYDVPDGARWGLLWLAVPLGLVWAVVRR